MFPHEYTSLGLYRTIVEFKLEFRAESSRWQLFVHDSYVHLCCTSKPGVRFL